MKKISLALVYLWSFSVLAATNTSNRFGLEADYGPAGANFGFVSYSNNFEAGIFGGYMFNNAAQVTKTSSFSFSVGHRTGIDDSTFFSVGADMTASFGTFFGSTGYSPWRVGPYVAIERLLSADILLSAWIYPYQYSRSSGDLIPTVNTHSFLTQGQIGVSYFF